MHNARKHILISPAFQLRFAFLLCLTVVSISAIFPIFFLSMFDVASTHPVFASNPAIQMVIKNSRNQFLMLTLTVQAVLVVGCFILAIFQSHRIVGPLYKLRISMTALRQGLLERHIKFRKGDNFLELADEFNLMSDALLARRRKDFEAVQSVIPKLDRLHNNAQAENRATLAEVLNVLREIVQDSSQQK